MTRAYEIEDDGESVHLTLIEDGVQVGGGLFPWEDSDGYAFSMAQEVAEDWAGVQPTCH
jgi:hypothetical protein